MQWMQRLGRFQANLQPSCTRSVQLFGFCLHFCVYHIHTCLHVHVCVCVSCGLRWMFSCWVIFRFYSINILAHMKPYMQGCMYMCIYIHIHTYMYIQYSSSEMTAASSASRNRWRDFWLLFLFSWLFRLLPLSNSNQLHASARIHIHTYMYTYVHIYHIHIYNCIWLAGKCILEIHVSHFAALGLDNFRRLQN